jgi:pyrroloquinoline quinone biosynthesis protein E
MIAFGEESGASRMEFAHVQYYGWAFANRERLLPRREQVERSISVLQQAEARLRGKVRVEYVVPDYYAKYPKACMGGWGRKLMLITPSGDVLPCHAAQVIPGLRFENVQSQALREIWDSSDAFQKFRGEAWMREPCQTCDRRAQDFGGCRCQAFLLAGDAAVTDPVCTLTPQRAIVDEIIAATNAATPAAIVTKPDWLYRANPS